MPGNFKKEDLRNHRTRKALLEAMTKLLEVRNYNQITINDLCEEALIGRSTFYSHFNNKYDLLRCWLISSKENIGLDEWTYDAVEKKVNGFAYAHQNVIKNLLTEITRETSDLFNELLLSFLRLPSPESGKGVANPDDVIMSALFCGGIVEYLLWQVKHRFPPSVPVMNRSIYDLFLLLHQWNERRKIS